MRVAPFGCPRISGYLLLPAAFRSLSRPSSAPSAKASALRSCSLDLLPIHTSVCAWGSCFLFPLPGLPDPRVLFPQSCYIAFLDLFRPKTFL